MVRYAFGGLVCALLILAGCADANQVDKGDHLWFESIDVYTGACNATENHHPAGVVCHLARVRMENPFTDDYFHPEVSQEPQASPDWMVLTSDGNWTVAHLAAWSEVGGPRLGPKEEGGFYAGLEIADNESLRILEVRYSATSKEGRHEVEWTAEIPEYSPTDLVRTIPSTPPAPPSDSLARDFLEIVSGFVRGRNL